MAPMRAQNEEDIDMGRPITGQKDCGIHLIQKRLVQCQCICKGITRRQEDGYIPRCLHLELPENMTLSDCSSRKNCIIVGLNPGKVRPEELQFYRDGGGKWDSFSRFFQTGKVMEKGREVFHKELPYFDEAIKFIRQDLGYDGAILWTDLAKCESKGRNGVVPVQTLRVCIDQYLREELELFPDWQLFTLGVNTFEFCALRFPNRFIVGLYHPSGAPGWWKIMVKMFRNDRSKYLAEIAEDKDENRCLRAIHLGKIHLD